VSLDLKILKGGVKKSDVNGSKLQQLLITMQNFVEISRRVSENEDLMLKNYESKTQE